MEDPLYVEINVQAENKHKNGEELQANFPLEEHPYSIILKQGEDNPNFIVHTWWEGKMKLVKAKSEHLKRKWIKKIELFQTRIALHPNVRIAISQRMWVPVFPSYKLCFQNHSLRPL